MTSFSNRRKLSLTKNSDFSIILRSGHRTQLPSLECVCQTSSTQLLPLIGRENLETKFQERNLHKIESTYPLPPG